MIRIRNDDVGKMLATFSPTLGTSRRACVTDYEIKEWPQHHKLPGTDYTYILECVI